MLIYSLITCCDISDGSAHLSRLDVGSEVPHRRDLCRSVLPLSNDVLHQPKVTGRGLLNPVRSNCSSRRRLIMREKVGMLSGHLKRISDWTNCAGVAKRRERRARAAR